MTWYRKYRPRTVAGLHLTKVRELLQSMMLKGQMPQVLLFAGPKGTGKTSTARIIGALLNDPVNKAAVEQIFFQKKSSDKNPLQEPQTQAEWLDKIFDGASYLVQEMDAASNRGIDDVRLLRERVALPPQEGVMSVYILDEAHMMTTEAFNALLKLLEEPPPHAVFILATTERHKIPDTIISRCTVFPFTKATAEELKVALEQVLQQESITFDPDALETVAELADGSFRDAIKQLEQVSSGQTHLTQELVSKVLAGSVQQYVPQVVTAVTQKDATAVAEIFYKLRQESTNQEYFFKQLCAYLHTALLQNLGVTPGAAAINQATALFLLQELQTLTTVTHSAIPLLPLELKLLDVVFRAQQRQAKSHGSGSSSSGSVKKSEVVSPSETLPPEPQVVTAPVSEPSLDLNTLPSVTPTDSVPSPVTTLPSMTVAVGQAVVSDNLSDVPPGDSSKLLEQWEAFVELVSHKNSSVAALLRTAKPMHAEQGKVKIAVFYKFHQEQLQQPKFRQMIDECVVPMTGGKVALEFVLADPPTQTETTTLTSMAEELLV
jgi:DNA polymerase-3 subunit gamma/tau